MMPTGMSNSDVLDYFEAVIKDVIIKRLATAEGWEKSCIPADVREDATERYERTKRLDNVLNKPERDLIDLINFDAYHRIITRKDNWRSHFEEVFLEREVFSYKMRIIQSLRNDIRHGRKIDRVNEIRVRLHCYDILAQVYEAGGRGEFSHDALAEKLGLI